MRFLGLLLAAAMLTLGCERTAPTYGDDSPALHDEAESGVTRDEARPAEGAALPAQTPPDPDQALPEEELPGLASSGWEPQAKLPETLPSDVPVYTSDTPHGARVVAARSTPGRGQAFTLRSSDSPDEIVAFYRSELDAQGWTIDEDGGRGRQKSLRASKGGRRMAVTVIGDDDSEDSQILVTSSEGID